MTPKLPVVSGEQVIKALRHFGYLAVRQKGSHVRMRNDVDPRRLAVTIPLHHEIAFGTLKRILRDSQLTVEGFLSAL